jgi:selenocysteine-specific elongation factor
MILGTAGHIDHGKSALVEALTGTRMDPLAEERRRGITLDLHFAALRLADGSRVGVVDVPGHEDLVRTMVAGAAGIDLVLLVIAADEGIMPQTREHLLVAESLGIPVGIPVVTKADLVDGEWLRLVEAEVAAWLSASSIHFGPPLATSIRDPDSITRLTAVIRETLPSGPRGVAADLARLPIDRVFSLAGAGTVVTGTQWSGQFTVGESVVILPAGAEGRIRSLESHGEPVQVTGPGQRVAVALAQIDREGLSRGQSLVHRGDPWMATRTLDAWISLHSTARGPLVHQTRIRVHHGSAELLARVRGPRTLNPGESGLVRLLLEQPLVARGMDRLVVRSYSPATVLGGGWVLDPVPPRGKPQWTESLGAESPADRLVGLLGRRPEGVLDAEVPLLLGVAREAGGTLRDPRMVAHAGRILLADRVAAAREQGLALLTRHHEGHPTEPGLPLELLRQAMRAHGPPGDAALEQLLQDGRAVSSGATVRLREFQARASANEGLVARVIQHITDAGLQPPTVAELSLAFPGEDVGAALRIAAATGHLVAVERGRHYSRAALDGFRVALQALGQQGPITPAGVREVTGASRKYLIPLLEWADGAGLTLRRGDQRVAGPRLSEPLPPGVVSR